MPGSTARDDDTVSHQLVLERLLAAQPRIVAAIETIIRAIPDDYAGVSLIPADAVASVLARPVLSPAAPLPGSGTA